MATTVAAGSATVDPDDLPSLRLDSIPTIDLRLLLQSELYSLSKCSNSSCALNRCDDVVIPKIDRSVFNESAGSRKQTYSRLRLLPAVTSTSSKTTIHRRSPHLRASHARAVNSINDPEQAENSQIVRVLKELFKSDSNSDDLAPMEVENNENEGKNDVVPELLNPEVKELSKSDPNSDVIAPVEVVNETNEENDVVPEPLSSNMNELIKSDRNSDDLASIEVKDNENEENAEDDVVPEPLNPPMKRKRGRPRKHENAVFISPPASKRMRNDTVEKVVVYDKDLDREIMNCRGVKVNLANLCNLEDPYGPEIRKRTEGLSTADELLGFMRGLNGEWGTTRKKRRVVDASDFGDYLPKGWKLSLAVKKKGGHVWLFCRRYVSPSGRYFESCKEVSMYLISIFGEEDLDKPSHTNNNDCVDSALKGNSENAAELNVQDDLNGNKAVDNSSTRPISVSTECDVQVEELFKCLECLMIFEGKTNLLDHQVSAHKSAEYSIVIGGAFECKFCGKTFYEINQYNGHIGTHENTTPEASKSPTAEKTVNSLLISSQNNVVRDPDDTHFGENLTAKRIRNSIVKKIVDYDNDKDREIMNPKGVKVNLVDLGQLDDPYGPEIRRRTEGMLSQDELLGFLRGLNGQWGTTRKKRRVVYASDFGDYLPTSWKLSLAVKKKGGSVWLFCRRYISPSGRQFESCKDVSVYLLSIVGEENLDKLDAIDCFDPALKEASQNKLQVADPYAFEEDLETNSPKPSPPPISPPTNNEKHIITIIPDSVDLKIQGLFKCLKCFIIFEGKNDLLDHQKLSHKDENKSEIGSGMNDWSIVIGGIFECNLCHKTFYEKNMYNAHVGTHVVTNENKITEESEALTAEKTIDHVSISVENTDAREIDGADCGIESRTDELVYDLNMNENVLIEESGDLIEANCNLDENEESVPKSDFRFSYESGKFTKSDVVLDHGTTSSASCGIEKDLVGKSSGQDSILKTRVDNEPECILDQGKSSGNSHFSPFSNEPIVNESARVSENRVQNRISSIFDTKGFPENINDMDICNSFDEFTSEKDKIVNSDSSSFEDCSGESKKLPETESLSLFSPTIKAINNANLISSNKVDSSQKLGFAPTYNHQVTNDFVENKFSYGIQNSKLENDVYNAASSNKSRQNTNLDNFQVFRNTEPIRNQNVLNSAADNNIRFNNTGKNLEFSSLVPRANEQTFGFQDDVTGLYDSAHESSEKGLLDHFCVDETSDDIFGNNYNSTQIDGIKFNENVHELSLAFGQPQPQHHPQPHHPHHPQPHHPQPHHPHPHPHPVYSNTINVNEQKKNGVNFSVVQPKIENRFDVRTDLSMVNNSMVEDLKSRNFQQNDNSNTVYTGRTWEDFRSDEFRSSENKKFMIGSSSSQIQSQSQNQSQDRSQTQTQNRSQSQSQRQHNEVLPRGMWNTGEANRQPNGFPNPHAQIQSMGYHSFDIMSDKAEDGAFRPDERYNHNLGLNTNQHRSSGRPDPPVEFRFLTGRPEHNNARALQPGSRTFPYNTGMEQTFDPSFWMPKNGGMPPNLPPNMGGRNVVTSVCAWCRNEFQIQAMAIHMQTQAGVGSLCPNCSAGISGQVNML